MSKWEAKSLGKVIKKMGIRHCSSEMLNDIAVSYGDIKLLSTGNFDGYTTAELSRGYIYDGEVITLPTGGAANIKYYKGKFIDSGNIVFSANKNISTKYIYYTMIKENRFYEGCYRGSSIKHPEMKDVLSHKIQIPTNKLEANKIAEALSSVDDVITQTKDIIAKYKNIKSGLIKDLLINNKKIDIISLSEIGLVRMCKRVLKHQTDITGEVPFYKIGTFGESPDSYISQNLFNYLFNHYHFPKKGDILISAAGTIGRIVKYNGEIAYFQDSNIVWIENNEKKVLNSILYYCLQNANWAVPEGSTIKRLYNSNIRQTKVFVPKDISEQKQVVEKLIAIDDKISAEQAYLDKMINLKFGLMHDLLNNIVSVTPLMKKEHA